MLDIFIMHSGAHYLWKISEYFHWSVSIGLLTDQDEEHRWSDEHMSHAEERIHIGVRPYTSLSRSFLSFVLMSTGFLLFS